MTFWAYEGAARGQLALEFCHARGMRLIFTSTISEYGELESALLCRAWCHRMAHFLHIYIKGGLDMRHTFSADETNAYTEPTELAGLAAEMHANRRLQNRIRQIRALFVTRTGRASAIA